jgi:hypothetical protein
MARKIKEGAVVVRLEGLYRRIMDDTQAEIERGDPRAQFATDERRRMNGRSPVIKQLRHRLSAMEDGEAVVMPCSYVGSHNCYPEAAGLSWLHDHHGGGVPLMLVTAWDAISPYHRHQNGRSLAG